MRERREKKSFYLYLKNYNNNNEGIFPQIKNIKIQNIRCWYDEHSFDFIKYTVFIGKNSTGNSTIQDTIFYGILSDIM